jgi:hypothetical protein
MADYNRMIGKLVYDLGGHTQYAQVQLCVDYDGGVEVEIDAENREKVVAEFRIMVIQIILGKIMLR